MPRIRVVNQLGDILSHRLSVHPSAPDILPYIKGGHPPWIVPDHADVLFTSPSLGWKDAPAEPPRGWPHALRWIQLSSAGSDTFPAWLFKGTTVTCGRGISSAPIAEYVMAVILAAEKKVESTRIHGRQDWRMIELGSVAGKTLGLLGYGTIGQAIARRAQAFDMHILISRRTGRTPDKDVVAAETLQQLFSESDYLVLAAPLTEKTRHIVNAQSLAWSKPGQCIINIARGGLVDQDALLAALNGDRLDGAILDVTDPEPLPEGHPLYTHPKARITPHISYSSGGHFIRLADLIIGNFDRYIAGRPLLEIVDPRRGY